MSMNDLDLLRANIDSLHAECPALRAPRPLSLAVQLIELERALVRVQAAQREAQVSLEAILAHWATDLRRIRAELPDYCSAHLDELDEWRANAQRHAERVLGGTGHE